MAEIDLGNLKPVELDLTGSVPYADVKEKTASAGFRLAPKGRYTVTAPSEFPDSAFGATTNGDISIQIDPTIAGPTNEGYTVKFTRVSSKVFDRDGSPVSQLGDYLRACGWQGKISSLDELKSAVRATASKNYQLELDWEAYNKRTGSSLKGMKNFPKLADGSHQGWYVDPAEVGQTDDQGRQLRVFANLKVPFGGFVPATE